MESHCDRMSFQDTSAMAIQLNKNYRSTLYIVEAASSLIQNNIAKRCGFKDVLTDNSCGSKECQNEPSRMCSLLFGQGSWKTASLMAHIPKPSYGSIAFCIGEQERLFHIKHNRERKIPFNVHGVAFYRKKVVKAIIAMLRTKLPRVVNKGSYPKALLPFEKEEKKRVIEQVDKIHNQSENEQSISAVINSVASMVPQWLIVMEKSSTMKTMNLRSGFFNIYWHDVSDFLSMQVASKEGEVDVQEQKGCVSLLKEFIDYITQREKENFHSRRHNNENSVTLTTIHQANESEIPLLHEFNGTAKENGTSIEEERRLFYVAMTRARKKLFITYVAMDSNWQV
ncbi:hypothetical protein NC652_041811 [Populus alba x Populus x berolinensis]|nr:hypothetical protein NC652_041811 [Populus alba x Populus x berolinensis]